ncbi:hypothetical protein HQQ80_20835 [Microbacteriaceae bacterium VKM Ac-2855]|nr:hypothetical protein [Microbacteriaceae bacterium VKM Ac-2855]
MSTHTRLQHSVSTACERGAMCVHDRSGHGLGALQLRLALATPSAWQDALVTEVAEDGWITLTLWVSGATARVWHHADVALEAGTPVALHGRYSVLLAGALKINVAQ